MHVWHSGNLPSEVFLFLVLFWGRGYYFFLPLGTNKIFFFLLQIFQSIFYDAANVNCSTGVSVLVIWVRKLLIEVGQDSTRGSLCSVSSQWNALCYGAQQYGYRPRL